VEVIASGATVPAALAAKAATSTTPIVFGVVAGMASVPLQFDMAL
jgi:hypothetical protein